MPLQRQRPDFVREHPELGETQPPLLAIEIVAQSRCGKEGLIDFEGLHFILRQRYSLINTIPWIFFESGFEKGRIVAEELFVSMKRVGVRTDMDGHHRLI